MTDKILLVDDDPAAIQMMANILAGMGELRFATNGEDALRLAREVTPDLIILDAEMRGMSGYKVLDTLKARAEMIDVPVIFVTSHSEQAFEVSAFEAGAADFIAKPIRPPLLLARVNTQLRPKRMTDQLRRAASTDGLTGVANRRSFDETLEHEWQRARRCGDPISLLLIDVDHFKAYNDRYGHPKGDTSLRQTAKALVSSVRRTGDLVARCGGEEFAVLLPQTPRDGALHVANRILGLVKALDIVHAGSLTANHLSVSIGVASYDESSSGWVDWNAGGRFDGEDRPMPCVASDLVLSADTALYAAKRAGRARASYSEIAPLSGSSPDTDSAGDGGLKRAG
jgi:diguanylate cyclase (GGDEF)-like protein